MTQEDKQLLLKDLCGRLPYGIRCKIDDKVITLDYSNSWVYLLTIQQEKGFVRPYLRPMSSMTDEEQYEYNTAIDNDIEPERIVDWYNLHHLDYRGLIPMGLALPAEEGMYSKQ